MRPWDQIAPELLCDLYELTMAASYHREFMSGQASFDLFVRGFPDHRSYFVASGVEHLADFITGMRFSRESLDWLDSLGRFSKAFLRYLETFRFTGSIRAIPEGRIFFAGEPVLEVSAPIIEAQVIETIAINIVQLETMIASKAARIVQSAAGRPVVDFSMRRTHGAEASLKVARASAIAGFAGTSNMLAGKIYGIPVYGTMAHSYVESFESELASFCAFSEAFPDNTVLLLDTWDTLAGAERAVEVARLMAANGKKLGGVRLDSGDLVELSRGVRRVLDRAGFPDVPVMVSGSLDETSIEELLTRGASVDSFAVGTRMGVSADAPYLDMVYKLVDYDGRPVLKLSSGKKTWPGRKQVYRCYSSSGEMDHDVISLYSDTPPGGEPLLEDFVREGERVRAPKDIATARAMLDLDRGRLDCRFRDNSSPQTYPVTIGPGLGQLDREVVDNLRRREK